MKSYNIEVNDMLTKHMAMNGSSCFNLHLRSKIMRFIRNLENGRGSDPLGQEKPS